MNKRGTMLWGFVGTVVLTSIMSAARGWDLTRINLPFILGTMVHAEPGSGQTDRLRDALINGWIFAGLYAAAFHSWRRSTWWLGAAIGAGPQPLRPGGRVAGRCRGTASAHGQRAAGPTPTSVAGAARLHGPELRQAHCHIPAILCDVTYDAAS